MYVLVAQSSLILCDPIDRSSPDSSVHRILQARTLERGAIPLLQSIFSTPGIKPRSPALQADPLLSEAPGKPHTFCSL